MPFTRAFVAVWVMPTLAITVPPIVYPHFLSFILPLGGWIFLCFAFLCVSALVIHVSPSRSGGESAPSLVFDNTLTAATSNITSEIDACEINVVDLERLQTALDSEPAEAVLRRLYDTNELLRPVRIDETRKSCSFAIISYRQVRSKHDSFTMDVDAFCGAVKKAHEADVDALWLDCWCYRREGAYEHAAFCAELATVMRHVAAVLWLPRSRTNAPPSYQFRLWCSFEASVVAQRRLPVYIVGQGLSRSQIALRRLGILLPYLHGMPPPMEVRLMAQVNSVLMALGMLMPLLIPALVAMVKGDTLAHILTAWRLRTPATDSACCK